MSPKNASEVLVGVAQMFIAPGGTVGPADPTVAPAVAWVDVGYSDEGWDFASEVNTADVEVAEELDALDVQATGRNSRMEGAAAQATIENLQIALGGGTITQVAGPPAYKQFDPPGSGDLTRYAILLRGKAPPVAGASKARELYVPWVVPTSSVNLRHRKAPDKTLIAMAFRFIKVSGTNLYRIRDLV
jgi:hypothetical protein